MEYKIRIEGGFTGIPKEYNGERTLEQNEWESLLEALESNRPGNAQLRDGLKYHVELKAGKEVFTAQFDESNLPSEIREFMNPVVQSNKKS